MTSGIGLFSLKGKTALVTGATGHLGRAISLSLAEAGANVLLNGRSRDRITLLVNEFEAQGLSAEGAVFDITDEQAVEAFFRARAELPLHVLVNNAYQGKAGGIEYSDAASYAESYDLTIVAAHRLLKLALPALRAAVSESGGASVINMTSMYAMVSPDQRVYDHPESVNPPFYGAAKAALLQWTRYAACEFGGEGIRINAISPGPFPAETVQEASPTFVSRLSQRVPMGRIGVPDELKGPALFLASSASSYVNGANLVVDGGWTCW